MNEKPLSINEKVAALAKAKKNLQLFSILFAACGIAIIFLLSKKPILGLVLTLVLVLIYLILFRKQAKDYRQAGKQAMLEEGLRPFLKNITYLKQDGISADEILSADFIPSESPKNMIIRDTVQGTYQTMPAFLTDITTNFQSYKSDKGGETKPVTDFLSGCLFDIQLSHSSQKDYILWSKKVFSEKRHSGDFSRNGKNHSPSQRIHPR